MSSNKNIGLNIMQIELLSGWLLCHLNCEITVFLWKLPLGALSLKIVGKPADDVG